MNNTVTFYYKSKLATVRDAEISDVFLLAPNMRQADREEVWKSHHKSPEDALLEGFTHSMICLTVEYHEAPVAMFGIVPHTILGNTATIWLLGSDKIVEIQRAFAKYSRHFIDMFLVYYPHLSNYVDVQNRQSIRWLRWCGAEFGPIASYGAEKQPFIYFYFRG